MTVRPCFSSSYVEARAKFIDESSARNLATTAKQLPGEDEWKGAVFSQTRVVALQAIAGLAGK